MSEEAHPPEDEFSLIARYCNPLNDVVQRDWVRLGSGDDCAVIAPPDGCRIAVSTDNLVAGVHFLEDMDAADIGWRSLAVSASDLAAQGAQPAFFTCALTLPEAQAAWVERFAGGLADCMRACQIPIVGGNLARGPLNICMTVHGWVPSGLGLTRHGAQPGDRIMVSGTLGAAAAGLHLLNAGAESEEALHCQAAYKRPQARLVLGQRLLGLASAAIDLSDGLAGDLAHLAAASGVAIEIHEALLPTPRLPAGECPEAQLRRWAWSGSDDYELCFTVAESKQADVGRLATELGIPLSVIGTVTAGQGVSLVDAAGNRKQPHDGGYRHF